MGATSDKTITLRYVAIVMKRPENGYFATVPDLGACFGYGDNIADARADLADALELHVAGMRDEMIAMPPARDRDEIHAAIDHEIVEDYVVDVSVAPLMRSIHIVAAPRQLS